MKSHRSKKNDIFNRWLTKEELLLPIAIKREMLKRRILEFELGLHRETLLGEEYSEGEMV